MLIDIEGIDGSGKGTQAQRLCDRLKGAGITASLVSFPKPASLVSFPRGASFF